MTFVFSRFLTHPAITRSHRVAALLALPFPFVLSLFRAKSHHPLQDFQSCQKCLLCRYVRNCSCEIYSCMHVLRVIKPYASRRAKLAGFEILIKLHCPSSLHQQIRLNAVKCRRSLRKTTLNCQDARPIQVTRYAVWMPMHTHCV